MVNFYFKRLIHFCFAIALTFIIPLVFIVNQFTFRSSYSNNVYNNTATVTGLAPATACTLTDATISQCTSSMVLSVDPGYTNYAWSTGATSNSITVTTSGTYWWETVRYDEDAVVNGNFENSSHYTGFTSNYTKNTSSLVPEGTYAVLKDAHSEHSSFATFNDHTKNDGTGYMMVVNGASVANVTVWSETISVQTNTTYVFSVWGTSVTSASPGILNFSINGSLLGNITLNSTLGSWQNFTVRWSSGSSTTATIGIVNQNTAASGNDFALDDISFAPVCRKNITANLYPNPAKPTITN